MALAQRKANSSVPLRHILGKRLKPGGGGSARRALSSLGSNNRRANLRLAESLLTISASEFRSKWNFDPLTETPLPQGQFLWTPVRPPAPEVPPLLGPVKIAAAEATRPKTKAESDLEACYTLPQKEVVSRFNDENSTGKVKVQADVQPFRISEVRVQPLDQTHRVSEVGVNVQPVGQTCKELRCLSVKSNACSEINKYKNINLKIPLCIDEENNNNLLTPASIPRNQRQSTITEFLRASKRPMPSSTSCVTPMGTSTMASNPRTTILPPPKLQKIISDGKTL